MFAGTAVGVLVVTAAILLLINMTVVLAVIYRKRKKVHQMSEASLICYTAGRNCYVGHTYINNCIVRDESLCTQ